MSEIKRINPRRSWHITAEGLRRIVLGETGGNRPEGAALPTTGTRAKRVRTPDSPSRCVLVIAHSERSVFDEHARQTVAAAAILADADTEVAVLVLGDFQDDLADCGADRVMVAPEFDIARFRPDAELDCIRALMEKLQPSRIYLPDNASGDGDLGRRLIAAQRSRKSGATQVAELAANHVARYMAGNSEIAVGPLPDIVLLARDAVETDLPFVGTARREVWLSPVTVGSDYCDLGLFQQDASDVALEEADMIVAAGNGVSHAATLEKLANVLGAAVGASRVAVDNGMFPRERQIGATGKTVSASAYLAVGISGAVQHLQGIKDCRHVIAINRDAGAPIVKRADLAIIGDAEDIMQSLAGMVTQAREEVQ